MCKRLFNTVICLLCSLGAFAAHEYGLEFVSHENIKDNRTSLRLTPRKMLKTGESPTLSFYIRFRAEEHVFGYVLRMVSDANRSLDMVSDADGGNLKVTFIDDGKAVAEFALRDSLGGLLYERWIPVDIKMDGDRDETTFSVGGERQTVPMRHEGSRFGIWFGACDHPDFYTTDVPPMSLRGVRVSDGKGRLLRHWKLDRHDGDTAYDATGRHAAVSTNPVWIVDGYARWQKKLSATIPQTDLNMAAGGGGVIYFAAGDYLAVYDNSRPGHLEEMRTRGPLPFTVGANQMVYDTTRGLLVAYDLETGATSTLSPDELQWSAAAAATPVPRYWHHNAAFLPSSDRIVTFGGYGEHTYKSQLNVVGPDGEWDNYDLSAIIPPRYLGGMVVLNDCSLLLAGGYGSVSGLQSESPYNFYDMWRIDPGTGKTERLADLIRDDGNEHFVFGRDMVEGPDGIVYALVYSDKRYASELNLVGIDVASGSLTRYADAVPYRFSDIESFCTLVRDSKNDELLLTTMHLTEEANTLVEVWSLKNPPLQIVQTEWHGSAQSESPPLWWLAGGLLAALASVAAIVAGARRYGRNLRPTGPKGSTGKKTISTLEIEDIHNAYHIEKRPSSILLLGGFQVIDRNGRDITGDFTQTIRALLLLILLETFKSGRGISSQKLKDTLWFDKDPENARNNRNVNIHKLRSLLQRVGNADVSGENSYWKLELGDDIFCDYATLLGLEREMETDAGIDMTKAVKFEALASSGKLLPNTQTEWVDEYKSEFTARLIEQLMRIAASGGIGDDPSIQLRVADAVLVHDNLDEDAIRIKCAALVRMGKKNQAKEAYHSFVANFKKALDSSPDFNLENILK